ncbi:hypothetical protein ILYODFUR_033671 [Ilyodon furcidens]|uniref:Uncharacterized protein n=1 Tax=Ilyodon furcidens TaxID=33524 RepID=A0ABV0UXH3_9TELE
MSSYSLSHSVTLCTDFFYGSVQNQNQNQNQCKLYTKLQSGCLNHTVNLTFLFSPPMQVATELEIQAVILLLETLLRTRACTLFPSMHHRVRFSPVPGPNQ